MLGFGPVNQLPLGAISESTIGAGDSVTSGQVQGSAATGTETFSGTIASGQVQGSRLTGTLLQDGQILSGQVQGSAVSGTLKFTGTIASGQVQGTSVVRGTKDSGRWRLRYIGTRLGVENESVQMEGKVTARRLGARVLITYR